MVEKVILNIAHSDAYTDYLVMTAGLTNKRIIPIISPTSESLKDKTDDTSLVLRCYNSRIEVYDQPVEINPNHNSIRIHSRFYLGDDGHVDVTCAEQVRQRVQEYALNCLMSPENLREVFRHYFPLIWSKRQLIYDDPKLFYADIGHFCRGFTFEGEPVGALLKAIEEEPRVFRIHLGGGCSCGTNPILFDFDRTNGHHWTLYTWCPSCGERREIRAWNFQRAWRCNLAIDESLSYYNKRNVISNLNLLNVIDAITSS